MRRRHRDRPSRLIFCMVGLPARGKSYIARRLLRYLSWLGYEARIFNLGSYRRRLLGAGQAPDFFSPDNAAGFAARHQLAAAALKDLEQFLDSGGQVAIYDGTNSTVARRRWLLGEAQRLGANLVFLESVTDDPAVIDANVQEKKTMSPDYTGVPLQNAEADFRMRLASYERVYETIDDDALSYVQLVDVGRQIIANRIQGYLPTQAVTFLMNLHLERRPVMLCRHGESAFNRVGRIGGDAPLTEAGQEFSRALAQFVGGRFGTGDGHRSPVVWTSTLQRSRQTAASCATTTTEWRGLDEIEAGVCDGMTYAEIQERYPDEYAQRQDDKLGYRYPRGESYLDVIERIHPLIVELERLRRPVLVVSHQAVLRVLYAYFMGTALERCPYIEVPLHTVVELTPTSLGCDEARHTLGPKVDPMPSS